ncbi:MAG: hypothetical protein WAK57_00400 [Desulfobacterales bacterium]
MVTQRHNSNEPVAIALGGVVGLKTIPKTLTAGWPVPDRFETSLGEALFWISINIEYCLANMENPASIFRWALPNLVTQGELK